MGISYLAALASGAGRLPALDFLATFEWGRLCSEVEKGKGSRHWFDWIFFGIHSSLSSESVLD